MNVMVIRFVGSHLLVYLVQNDDPELREQAERIADYLQLPLQIRHTGYGLLEERLVAMMREGAGSQGSKGDSLSSAPLLLRSSANREK